VAHEYLGPHVPHMSCTPTLSRVFKGDYIALDCVLDWLGVLAEFRYSLLLRWLEHGVAALLSLALTCFASQRFALL
jgi:hypothetical protein